MDRNTANTLILVALIFNGITLALLLLQSFIYIPIMVIPLLGMGADSFTICFAGGMVIFFLLFLIVPIVSLQLGYNKIYKPMKRGIYNEEMKKYLIICLVLSFLGGGGWIAAIMYIIVLVTWNELAYPSNQMGYPYLSQGYGHYPPPPGMRPPGY